MLLGYNTNGLAHHAPDDAMRLLAEIGYRAVALTIDHGVLNPRDQRLGGQAGQLRRLAKKLGLTLVVETGGRYLLDPWTKHEPTLVSPDPERRSSRGFFYEQAIDTAKEVGAVCVSLWSGVVRDGAGAAEAWDRLVSGLIPVLRRAEQCGIHVAFEPEPGMLVATLSDWRELRERLLVAGAPLEALKLTIDVGHLHCNAEGDPAELIERHASDLANVHVEDMRRGVHEHLPFGDGEIDFPPVLEALRDARYAGPGLRRTQSAQPRRAGDGAAGVRLSYFGQLTAQSMTDQVYLLSVPGLREKDLARMPRLSALTEAGDRAPLVASTPAVTCPVQTNLLTGAPPSEHGVVANGFYWREGLTPGQGPKHDGVEMWTAWSDVVQRPRVWERLKDHDAAIRSAVWFPLLAKGCGADFVCTFAPIHNPDGSESLWCYTVPEKLYGELRDALGHFPLKHFWGPLANIESSRWIVSSFLELVKHERPDFAYVYLPHLDYAAQKYGPDSDQAVASLRELDAQIGRLADGVAEASGMGAVVVDRLGVRDHRGLSREFPEPGPSAGGPVATQDRRAGERTHRQGSQHGLGLGRPPGGPRVRPQPLCRCDRSDRGGLHRKRGFRRGLGLRRAAAAGNRPSAVGRPGSDQRAR